MRYERVRARNRPSPVNEEKYIEAYKKIVPAANRSDNYDIAAVVTAYGTYGHALMHYSDNRSRDDSFHDCLYFVSDDELRLYF